jgi:hypothetical protein
MGTTGRLAKGCGCGCALLLILLGLLVWAGYAVISKIVQEAQEAEAVSAEVHETVGRVADYQPPADGAVPAERMELFLRARALMAETRKSTDADLAVLSSGEAAPTESVPGLLGELARWGVGVWKIEGTTSLIPQVIAFVKTKGEILMETGMGPGEYLYIYALAYYVSLEKSPADGPAFPIVSDDADEQGRRSGHDEFDVREIRREAVLRRVNEALLPMLRRQLEALGQEQPTAEADPWRTRLEAEIEAMEKDRFRIPWRDGLPDAIEASVAPYRGLLEASYSVMCNPLEVLTGTGE